MTQNRIWALIITVALGALLAGCGGGGSGGNNNNRIVLYQTIHPSIFNALMKAFCGSITQLVWGVGPQLARRGCASLETRRLRPIAFAHHPNPPSGYESIFSAEIKADWGISTLPN